MLWRVWNGKTLPVNYEFQIKDPFEGIFYNPIDFWFNCRDGTIISKVDNPKEKVKGCKFEMFYN